MKPAGILVFAIVLAALALFTGGVSATDRPGFARSAELEKVTDRNIHEKLAVDIIREVQWNIKPQDVVEAMVGLGNVIVPAPDPTDDHPNLFYMTAMRYQVMKKDQLVNPQLNVVVLKDAVSISYREKVPASKQAQVLQFCNDWNTNYRLATCYADKTHINLHTDIVTVPSPNEAHDSMVSDFNRILLTKGVHDYQLGLQRFSKKFINTLVLTAEEQGTAPELRLEDEDL